MSSAVATRARATPLGLVRAVPAWGWVAGLVVVSAAVRYAFARQLVAPWIVVDEIVYSELAKSFAATGSFLIRDQPASGSFGVVYPVLISPAYRLFGAVPSAYEAIKVVNSIAISLTVVPAYLLARTVLRTPLALAAAALSVAVPSMLYAGTVMTENAFYPLFVLSAFLLVRALERPTLGRSLALLASVAVAYATRAQAVVVLPAIATAPPVLVATRRAGWRTLAAYWRLYASLAGAVVLAGAVQLLRGHDLADLLGAYRIVSTGGYDASEVRRWLLYHVAELDLYVAVAPFAAFLLLMTIARRLPRADQTFLAAAVSLAAWMLVAVAAFASKYALRIEERNDFYLAPLFLVALLVWIERGAPRPRLRAFGAVAVAAALPLFIPFASFVNVSAQSDTLALIPWWDVWDALGGPGARLLLVVWIFTFAIAALVLTVPARYTLVVPAVVLAAFAVASYSVEQGPHGMRRASIGALFQGMTTSQRDWIDRAVGRRANVPAVWSGPPVDPMVILENEFFNRSVGDVYYLGAALQGGLPQRPLRFDPQTGSLRGEDGRPVEARYALVDAGAPIAGRIVARDAHRRTRLLRVDGPLHYAYAVFGGYADGWYGRQATYVRYRCHGGTLRVTMDSDAGLFDAPQRVVARVRGRVVARGRIPRVGTERLRVPLAPSGDRCVVRLTVTPTAVPGKADRRRLGTHYRTFAYRP